jgi:hypothetical protein
VGSTRGIKRVVKDALQSRLFLMTVLGAATGQVSALAAQGALARPSVAATVGVTVVGGVGAICAALEEARLDTPWGRRVFAAAAVLSIGANVAAAAAGLAFAEAASVDGLRYVVAGAILAVAVEVGRGEPIDLPHSVPAPAAVVGVGLALQVLL